ncbi:MAG TPA: HlyD family efflux transporter periplasmic adaptor subunit [Stellaceae bacterium]|nr:HlyD family efflux transporter periplasmic adaptor subunit [Stellaceae bacterium]
MLRHTVLASAALLAISLLSAQAQEQAVVAQRMVDDRKAVIATVEPVHELMARARIGGTITSLSVKEGDQTAAGDRIAVVVDQKLLFQMQALASRIQAQQAERDQAQVDLGRAQELRQRGAGTQVALDQAKTRLDVAERTLQALRSDRQVIEQQAAEGAVLAPGAGRVLSVPVSQGSVVLGGETIATIAAQNYILRLQLPERHARFIKAGDTILVGARGLAARGTQDDERLREGRVVLVYPEIKDGRVIADVEVAALGDYFVGERTRVYVSTGKRAALVVPQGYLYRRFGVNYARLKDGTEIVVQPGLPVAGGIEVLAGLHPGDVIVKP